MNGKLEILEGLLIGILAITTTGAGATNNVAAPAAAAPTVDSQDYDVKRFLEEAPPLRKIIYGLDIQYYRDVNEPDNIRQARKGFVCYEGAFQPETFYLRTIGARPEQKTPGIDIGSTAGASSDGINWTVDMQRPEGLVYTSNRKDETSAESHSGGLANRSYDELNRARSLWINGLVPGSVRWIDKNRFEGKASGSERVYGTNKSERIILGEIAEYDELGRPTKIKYRWPAMREGIEVWNDFLYTEPVSKTKLPNIIVKANARVFSDGKKDIKFYTNILLNVDIGTTNIGDNGYVPKMFLEMDKSNPYVVYESNHVIYKVERDGLTRFPDEESGWIIVLKSKWFGIPLIVCLILFPFLWKIRIKNSRG